MELKVKKIQIYILLYPILIKYIYVIIGQKH